MSSIFSTLPDFSDPRAPLTLHSGDYTEVYRTEKSGSSGALLSIAIPTFRRTALLWEALESIRKLKPAIPFEVVVVDNDVDDDTGTVQQTVAEFSDLPLVLYRNSENVGMFGNWNRCLMLPATPWVTILNDDDMLLPDFLIEFQELQRAVPPGWIYLQFGYGVLDERIDDQARRIDYSYTAVRNKRPREVTLQRVLAGNTRAGSLAMVFERESAARAGGFDPAEYPTADYCFIARLLTTGKRAWECRTPAALYRVFQNESLKPEVMAGFVANDYRMLRDGVRFLQTPAWLVKWYAHIRAIAYYYRLRKTWNVHPSRQALRSAVGLNPHDSRVESLVFRLLERLMRYSIY